MYSLDGYMTEDERQDAIAEQADIFMHEVGFSEYIAEQAATAMIDDGLSFDEAVGKYGI